jgi:hypothetical protein
MPRRNDIAKILIIGSKLIILILSMFVGSLAKACTIFSSTVTAAPNFDLLVQDHGKPVAGIRIVVTSIGDETHRPVVQATSNQQGKVAVRGLLPGEYSIDNLGPIQTGGLIAVVKKNGFARLSKPITFQWPSLGIAKTKRLEGVFRSADPEHPFDAVEVSVSTAADGTELASSNSGSDGRFDFGNLPAGLYVVQVRAKQPGIPKNWEVEGPIAVEVTQGSSSPNQLELALGKTSCGIWYAQCPEQKSIELASRQIKVSDPNGAVIRAAQYSLEDKSGRKVANGESNHQGVIELSAGLGGGYKLKIYSTGFTPLEQPLNLITPEASAKSLNVLLNTRGNLQPSKAGAKCPAEMTSRKS